MHILAIFKQKKTFSVFAQPDITDKRGRETMNSRRFLDSYTTVENSPKTQKENAKLHVMAMIKREILTIREVLYTKSCKLLHT